MAAFSQQNISMKNQTRSQTTKCVNERGYFVLCDVQKEYAENLLRILKDRMWDECAFYLFFSLDGLKKFSENNRIHTLILAEEYEESVSGEGEKISAERTFILTEKMSKNREVRQTGEEKALYLFRYQPMQAFLHVLEEEEGEAKKEEQKEELKTTEVRSTTTVQKTKEEDCAGGMTSTQKIKRVQKMDSTDILRGVIGVYSPIHRIGKTRFALSLGRKLSEKCSVLYLNMEGYSGGDYYFKGENTYDMGDLLYYLRQDTGNLGLKISTMAEQKEGPDYVMPMAYERDLRDVRKEEWIRMIELIRRKCDYEILILDLGESLDGLYDILRCCSRIYTPYIEEGAALAKLEQYEDNLKKSGYGDILGRTVRRKMGKARRISEE